MTLAPTVAEPIRPWRTIPEAFTKVLFTALETVLARKSPCLQPTLTPPFGLTCQSSLVPVLRERRSFFATLPSQGKNGEV